MLMLMLMLMHGCTMHIMDILALNKADLASPWHIFFNLAFPVCEV
jgi:uncharacterized membrane protein